MSSTMVIVMCAVISACGPLLGPLLAAWVQGRAGRPGRGRHGKPER